MGLALASGGSVLEPADTGSVRHRGSFQQFLAKATLAPTPLPKPCHTNPMLDKSDAAFKQLRVNHAIASTQLLLLLILLFLHSLEMKLELWVCLQVG